jgi:hypothetical protein
MCVLLYMRLLISRHHATVNTQKQFKLNTYDMGAHFTSNLHFIFRFILVHEMSLRQKGTYAPPQDKACGLNIHDDNKSYNGPI